MSDISKIKVSGVEYNVKDSAALRDAPSDGKTYARKNGAWSEVESGGYEPPVGGIPKTDLASAVQTSLDKADSAVQHDDLDDYVSFADTEEAETLQIDTVVTSGSNNLITSGAVYSVLGDIEAAINTIRGVS